MNTLRELFIDELKDMYDAEHRILKALPKLIKAATAPELREALTHHLQETETHVTSLEGVFDSFDEKPASKKCKATVGLLEEGDEIVKGNEDSPAINAAIISAGQKVEHYEIASYGTLHAWALVLGNNHAAELLLGILEQEKNANQTLTDLSVNENEKAKDMPVETHSESRLTGASSRKTVRK